VEDVSAGRAVMSFAETGEIQAGTRNKSTKGICQA
jgi:hypothetical protein